MSQLGLDSKLFETSISMVHNIIHLWPPRKRQQPPPPPLPGKKRRNPRLFYTHSIYNIHLHIHPHPPYVDKLIFQHPCCRKKRLGAIQPIPKDSFGNNPCHGNVAEKWGYLLGEARFIDVQPVYLRSLIAISLPSCSLRSNRGITLSIPRIKTNTGARAFSSCTLSLWNNLPLSVRSATLVATFRRPSQNIPFRLGLPPVNTGVPYCLLMLWNDFNDFAFEHRSGCCVSEPDYAGDISAIEIWLIDRCQGNTFLRILAAHWKYRPPILLWIETTP